MKRLSTLLFTLLACTTCMLAATINVSDFTFPTASIKGETMLNNTADINVSWNGLSTEGVSMFAEVTEGEADEEAGGGFYVVTDSYYLGYGAKYTTSTTFTIGYLAYKAGTFNGKIRFHSYDASYNDVEKTINVSVTITSDAIVAKTTTYTRVNTTSELAVDDIVVFVSESAGAVGGALDNAGTALEAITQDVKVDAAKGTAEIPETAHSFKLSKYNGNWQFTNTATDRRLLLDISGKGAFSYGDTDKEHLAGWGISISKGVAVVSRPDDDQSFAVRYNDRFKPYKNFTGSDIALYKKTGDSHELQSTLSLSGNIDLGEVELSATKQVEVTYTAEYLEDDILWDISGNDKDLFTLTEDANNSRTSGKLTIAYNGKGTKTGKVDAKLDYLTTNIQKDEMEGSFPINLTLVGNTVKLTSITFDEAQKTAFVGQTLDLSKAITLTPADAADKSLRWESSSTTIATIDQNGVLTPLASGKVTITVSSVAVPEVSAKCDVTIKVPAPTAVTAEPAELNMHVGEKTTVKVNVLPQGANMTVSYSIDNTNVATVSAKGLITAKALGKAVLTIATTANADIKTSVDINVTPYEVENISFPQTKLQVAKGGTLQLQPVVTPQEALTDNELTFKSADESIATVSSTGLVTGIAEGSTLITAAAGNKQTSVTIEVVAPSTFAFVTDPATLGDKDTIVLARQTETWAVAAGARDGKKLTVVSDNVIFTDNSVAADDALRIVLGKEKDGFTLTPVGTTKGLAEKNNDIVDATANNNRLWQFVADGNNGVYVQNTGNTNAYFKYLKNINTEAIKPYKGNSAGAEYVYVYVRHFEAPAPIHVTGVSLDQTTLELEVGKTAKLKATITPADANDKSVTWSSSDEAVATVANGTVSAIAAGNADITVTTTDGAFTATCRLTVTAAPLGTTPEPFFSIGEGEVKEGTVVKVIGAKNDTVYARANEEEWQHALAQVEFTINEETTIEAYAVREGYSPSDIISATYTITVESGIVDVTTDQKLQPRLLLQDGTIVIELPDGIRYDTTGKRLNQAK